MSTPTDQTPLGGEPPTANKFLLEVDGVSIGVFSEVRGLELTVGVEEFREGGQNGFSYKLPGRISWPNLVFKSGITDSDALFTWVNKSAGQGFSANGNMVTRCTGAVTLIADDGTRLRAWNLEGVMAVRWSGPQLSASSNEALQEELEVAHHGFTSSTTAS